MVTSGNTPLRSTRRAMMLAMLLAAGCVSEPQPGSPDAIESARRLIVGEFRGTAGSARLRRVAALPRAVGRELRRPADWRRVTAAVDREAARASQAVTRAREGVGAVFARRPADIDRWLLDVHAFERDIADDLALSMRLIATSLHPLGEISDRRHRTDPRDDRPEKTFWQRLRRRLGL